MSEAVIRTYSLETYHHRERKQNPPPSVIGSMLDVTLGVKLAGRPRKNDQCQNAGDTGSQGKEY